jgi:hypothetical protein
MFLLKNHLPEMAKLERRGHKTAPTAGKLSGELIAFCDRS